MKKPSESTVVGLGELLWDVFPDSRRPGGAPANVAFHVQQLGYRGVVCSRVGEDELGRELLDYLAEHHLDTNYIQRDPAAPTGHVSVDASNPEHPSYTIHESVAWDNLEMDDQLDGLMSAASAVCFGTLAQRSPRSRKTIQACLDRAQTSLLVYDVNLRQHYFQRDWIERSLRAAHVMKLNEAEVETLAGLLDIRHATTLDFARALQDRYGLLLLCVTRADKGCTMVEGDDIVEADAVPIRLADAVGAGDAFTAALIVARLRRWPVERTAVLANRVGALVASRHGAMPELGMEYARLLSELEG